MKSENFYTRHYYAFDMFVAYILHTNRHDRSDITHKLKICSVYMKYFTYIGKIVPISIPRFL